MRSTVGARDILLRDGVLVVLDSLKINKPVLVGHSIGGEELSSVGSGHPEKVAALIYLDAGCGYAYYDRSRGDYILDLAELRKKLEQLQGGIGPPDTRALIREMLATILPGFERDLREAQKLMQSMPASSFAPAPAAVSAPNPVQAIVAGEQKYTNIPVPVLAIFAVPRELGPEMGSETPPCAPQSKPMTKRILGRK